jgi:hypothetical protein
MKANPPNLPMFARGTTPFIGDYIDVQGPMFVSTPTGWQFNYLPAAAPVFHAVWTSNQDVVPPLVNVGSASAPVWQVQWSAYTPPVGSATAVSQMDGVTPISCTTATSLTTGSRNQNIYSARITEGILVTTPQNFKYVDASVPSTFVVSVYNATAQDRNFDFSLSAPVGGTLPAAAFVAANGSTMPTLLGVPVRARSSSSQTVTMTRGGATNPATTIVTVTDGTYSGTVTLNPPGTIPADSVPGAGTPSAENLTVQISAASLANASLANASLANASLANASLANASLVNASLANASLVNSDLQNASLANASLANASLVNASLANASLANASLVNASLANASLANASLANASLANASLANASLANASLANASLANASLANASLANASLANASISDLNYTVTNTGSTTQAFNLALSPTVATAPVQVIVSKPYGKPVAMGCEVREAPDNQVVVNAGTVPDPSKSSGTLGSFSLAPGEKAQVTLRSFTDIPGAIALANTIAPVVAPQGNPGNAAVALHITNDATLASGKVGKSLFRPLLQTGAVGGEHWECFPADACTLPPEVGIVDSALSGTPTTAGSFTFSVQVTDGASPPNVMVKTLSIDISKGTTTAGLSTSAATAYHGVPVTLTATVAGSGATGTVTFQEASGTLGTASLSSGTASLTIPSDALAALPVGAHAITATYGGDANWTGSTSAAANVQIKVQTVLSLTTTPTAPAYGDGVQLVANLVDLPAGAPMPANQALFYDGGSYLGVASFSSGSAALPAIFPAGGAHAYSVSLEADANYDAATASLSRTVNPASTTLVLESSANPAFYNGSVDVKARAFSAAGTPDGTVTFTDTSTGVTTPASLDLLGWAKLTISGLAVGAHPIVAHYAGTANFAAADGTFSQTVNAAPTTPTLSVSAGPWRFAETIRFSCKVSSSAGSPTGTVTFSEGTTILFTAAAPSGTSAGSPVWTWETSTLPVGDHPVKCAYASDGNFGSSTSAASAVFVDKGVTTTDLKSAPATTTTSTTSTTAYYGDAVVLSAKVAGSGATGTVTFLEGGTPLGNPVSVVNGTASLTLSSLGVGAHTIVASYSGDGSWASSTSGVATVQVKVHTALSLSTVPTVPVFGGSVQLVATLSNLPSSAPMPTTRAQFYDGAFPLGSASFSSGSAVLPAYTPDIGGTHGYSVSMAGDANYDPFFGASQATLVAPASVSLGLSSSANPGTYGTGIVFTAGVSWPGTLVVPTGSVTFSDTFAGITTTLGTAAVDSAGNAALLPLLLPGGTHTVTAAFLATANFAAPGPVDLIQVVSPAVTSAALALPIGTNPSVFGKSVTLSCAVSSAAGIPGGTVTFLDATTLPATSYPAALSGGIATLTSTAFGVGDHPITCQFGGDANFVGATSNTITLTVTSPATLTTLAVSSNPVLDDKPVTFTATVKGTTGVVSTGTVTFRDGAKVVGSAAVSATGTAVLTLKSLNEGTHTITAAYGGSASFAGSTSAPLSLKVLEDYSCKAYSKPLVTGGTVSSPSRSGTFTFGTKVAVKWQFVKPTGVYVSRNTAVKGLAAVFDSGCTGKPATGAARVVLFDPTAGVTTGSTFTYDSAGNQYFLNWDTSRASRGCWDIVLTPDNGIPQVATIVKLQ